MPAPHAPAASLGTLTEFDERLGIHATGVVIARTASESVEALLAHAARRLGSVGRAAIVARSLAGAPLWHGVAARLGLTKLPSEPLSCAGAIASNALLRRVTIVAPLPRGGSWDRAVAAEIALLASAPLVVFVSDGQDPASDLQAERFNVAPTLHDDAKARWWRALAEEAHGHVGSSDLAAYEAWWASVKRVPAGKVEGDVEIPSEGLALFTRLALAAAPWAVGNLAALGGDAGALEALVGVGAVEVVQGWVTVAPAWAERAEGVAQGAELGERQGVAGALMGDPDPQPWAFARASELLAHPEAGQAGIDEADRAHSLALSSTDDTIARREVVARWMTALEGLPVKPRRVLLMRAAERALSAGEPDEAARCASAAIAESPEDAGVLFLVGRASAATGDMVAARVALERARSLGQLEAPSDLDSLVEVELAEIAYRRGEVATARQHAAAAVARSADPATRLKGRNTLGKLLLLEARWDDADRHFAEDGLLAIAQRNVVAELRARLNRGIALLSKGRLDEARDVFDGVLAEGERRHEPRARAYALTNLAVMAWRRHDYGAALAYWERTLKLLHVLRDRVTAAITLANVAQLRHSLGLIDHAEHAVSFGRRTLGSGITAPTACHFGIIAAQIALTRGRTVEARREIEASIALSESSGSRELMSQAHLMAAHIGLEDGDLGRVTASLCKARELTAKSNELAELELLQARLERASGRCALETAESALALARAADEEELVREAHVLLADLHRANSNRAAARDHVGRAVLIRDRMAEGLSEDLRVAFLARNELAVLARLQAQLEEPASTPELAEDEASSSGGQRATRTNVGSPREIIGDDPAVRGLLAAIRKVARSSSTVLIRGESGTGKELIAEALHHASDRRQGPLVTVNCAALVETLLLSELFGHEKGAFTGAASRRRGRFELAEGGTLFLDEIGDISPRTQVALLRVLQERTFERVGGTTAIHANVRIVCATHRDLRAMVERGEFREDLYYRLRGITLEAPSLRARLGDIPRIAEHLLARIAVERGERSKSLNSEALELLGRHKWPGNVRELENALRAASLFADGEIITASDLTDNVDDLRAYGSRPSSPPPASDAAYSSHSGELPDDSDPSETDGPLPQIEANATAVAYAQVRQGCVTLSDIKRQIERDCIARALAETKGNITRAASLLGMKRPRLSQLVKQYGLAAVSSEA